MLPDRLNRKGQGKFDLVIPHSYSRWSIKRASREQHIKGLRLGSLGKIQERPGSAHFVIR
jgi:hypothetical protein